MKATTKQSRRAALDREFALGKMHLEAYRQRLEDINQAPDDGPAAPTEPDIGQVVEATRRAFEVVSANLTPLMQRVAAIEKQMKSREATAAGAGLSINAASIDIDLGQLANSIAVLNERLAQPVQAVFDSAGRVIGARRVDRLDS